MHSTDTKVLNCLLAITYEDSVYIFWQIFEDIWTGDIKYGSPAAIDHLKHVGHWKIHLEILKFLYFQFFAMNIITAISTNVCLLRIVDPSFHSSVSSPIWRWGHHCPSLLICLCLFLQLRKLRFGGALWGLVIIGAYLNVRFPAVPNLCDC